jgi:hypothetical protein
MKPLLVLTLLLLAGAVSNVATAEISIVSPSGASDMEVLAAKEVRRYFYLRTGELLPIFTEPVPLSGDVIVVARNDRALAAGSGAPSLRPEQYVLKSDGHRAWIVGGDGVGTLYAAYHFAEQLGIRFYLHGDVVPDRQIAPALPRIDEVGKPLFQIRGLLPFHDFPEGPDWWNLDDYLAYIGQLPKLRMNFIGFHNYPEGDVGPEPGVWIGTPSDIGSRDDVRFSYPSRWANTERLGTWGYAPMKTSEFTGGAGLLFGGDEYGPEVMSGMMPSPGSPEDSNILFGRSAKMFQQAFAMAKSLGVKTCIGTETPLTIPKLVQDRLVKEGKDPKDPAVVRELYEGIFRRIAAEYPVDYYWLWTPEDWTWSGNKPGQLEAATRDLQAALDALKAIGNPFTLATSGWVLGPQNDRAALDKFLPKDSPMSCINRTVGNSPDERGFANVLGRPKWVVPWLENDPSLTAPEPWAGRMRYDAVDALRLGCTGLLGIHWRTRILAPNIAALAAAAWDQQWVPSGFDTSPIPYGTTIAETKIDQAGLEDPQGGRTMPVEEFYIDFARANFGENAAVSAGKLLARIDGMSLPKPATWLDGPGGIKVETKPWSDVAKQYAFVEELAKVRDSVTGAGNLGRFDYWLNTYRYMEAMAEVGCMRGELDKMMGDVAAETDPAKQKAIAAKALLVRTDLARVWERMISFQIAATETPGELGTLANLEQHNRKFRKFLDLHDAALAQALGSALPPSTELEKGYMGPARIIVTTVRTLVPKGEPLRLKIILLDGQPAKSARLLYRPMGRGEYEEIPIQHVDRAVYEATIPPLGEDIEYYVEAQAAGGRQLTWPLTAPSISQTVIAR